MPADFIGKIKVYFSTLSSIDVLTTAVSCISLAVIIIWQKIPVVGKKIPASLVVIIIATVASRVLNLPLATIGSHYGEIPSALPSPTFPSFDFQLIRSMSSPAMSIALLCAIESLLSAMVADGMINTRHDSNTELMAQGLANLVSPVFGGIPATAAIARTSVAIKSMLVCIDDFSEDEIYALTKAIYENLDAIREINAKANYVSLESALNGIPMNLHPGAAKYYTEMGIEIPDYLK